MRVHVEEDIYLSHDGMNYVLEQRIVSKTGKSVGQEYYKSLSYHASISHALKSLLTLRISESKATTLRELADDIRSAIERLRSIADALEHPFKKEKALK